MDDEKPNYYAIIPAEVRYDKELRDGAKIFYGEITALCSKNGVCTASNNYFAKLYNMTPSGITHWVTQLKNKGYIKVIYEKDGNEIKQRKIYISPFSTNNQVIEKVFTNVNTVLTNVNRGTDKSLGGVLTKVNGGYLQKDKENNTSINNTSINNIPPIVPHSELFEMFWKCYPKKLNKGKAEDWFKKNKPSKEVVDKMIEQVNRYKDTKQWKENNGKFIPYAVTWLNGKRWEDEFETETEEEERIEKEIEEEMGKWN